MKGASCALLVILVLAWKDVIAQIRAPGPEFLITKISKNLVPTPQYTYSGPNQYQSNTRDRWLEVEVEFSATPPWTDDLTFKYYILFNGKLLTGEVTHTNVPAGRENHVVAYVSPQALERFAGNKTITQGMFQNIAVQIVHESAVQSELSLQRAAPGWFATIPQLPGFVLNKNETPFAPLYWDRYQQIKTAR